MKMSQGSIGELQLPPGWDVNLSRDYPPQHVFGTHLSSMWKTADISDAISGFPAKWHLGNERRNSILMTCCYPDLGSASDWLNPTARPNRSTTTFWVVTHHQNGISHILQCFPALHLPFQILRCQSHLELDWQWPPAPPRLQTRLVLNLMFH